MKRLSILIVLLAGVCSQILAQETDLKKVYTDVTTQINSSLLTRKGAFELSGSAFYDRLKNTYHFHGTGESEVLYETYLADLGVSYFFINNLAVGLAFSYLNQKTNFNDYYHYNISESNLGPLVKYYFGEKRWRPYLFANYFFEFGNVGEHKGEFDLGAGILYHLTGNIGLTLQVKYGMFVSKDDIGGVKQNRIFLGIGIANFIL